MNEFVKYINGLHNYSAQNQNSYGEKNAQSPYYRQTMVDIEVYDHIVSLIEEQEPHIIILTGHAGDGKTSIMYQVLCKLLASETLPTEPIQDVVSQSGKKIRCIKDFSELPDEKKHEILKGVMELPSHGQFAFVVANTGPLINTFGSLFDDEHREQAKLKLIEAMDSNIGKLDLIMGYKMMVINVAAIDNTDFAGKYLEKLLANEELWAACDTCDKREYCHILCNRELIWNRATKKLNDRVCEFIEYFYIHLFEHGIRLTIRSMTEQLSYMITGGYDCKDVSRRSPHNKRFFDLFFGYKGIEADRRADNIDAIRISRKSEIFPCRLRSDEFLLIKRDYNQLFGPKAIAVIEDIERRLDVKKQLTKMFDDELHRLYLFLNIVDDKRHRMDIEDVFSKQFPAFISVRKEGKSPVSTQKELVIAALWMIYFDSCLEQDRNRSIPVTLGADLGLSKNVMLVAGRLNPSDISLIAKPDSNLNHHKWNIVLCVKGKEVCNLSLPILEHFEELRNGVIVTNMDPQLSHGIENLKATLLDISNANSDDLDILIRTHDGGFRDKQVKIENNELSFQ